MTASQERILLVESDPEVSDLITRQALKPLGYQVRVVGDATMAIREAIEISPDVILVNLNLPGLSGKDLLVALSSQEFERPVIVIAEEGMEGDVIQAFRLGASDYLSWPVREAEVVSAVERALGQVRAEHERERLSQQLEKTNSELQRRVRELTTIFGIGKAVTSLTDQQTLFDKLIDGGVFVADADKGWLLLRHGESKVFTLNACKNMPKSIVKRIGQSWDDGISSLVALSGESLSIHGNPLKRFKVAQLGQSALVVPVKAQKEVVGIMVVMRDEVRAFSPSNQTMLEAIADYASISLMNAQLFDALEKRARSLQKAVENTKESEGVKAGILKNVAQELQTPLTGMEHQVELLTENMDEMSADHRSSVGLLVDNLRQMTRVVDALNGLQKASGPQNLMSVDLADLSRQALERFEGAAEKDMVSLSVAFQKEPLLVRVDPTHIAQVFDALLSNAVRYSAGGRVAIQAGVGRSGMVHVMVQDSGPGIELEHQKRIFQPFYQVETSSIYSHDGLGIGLSLAKDIVRSHGGAMWVKSDPGNGSVFHFTLPPAQRK
jgi:signal transduction histidine kinase/DNA-binding response OmpR family regulator